MNKEFTKYEQALALKEIGFNEPCLARHIIMTEWEKPTGEIILQMVDCLNSDRYLVKAPLYQQAFRWFRENKNISGEVYSEDFGGCVEYSFHIRDLYTEEEIFDNFFGTGVSYSGTFKTYEEAEQACLDKLIEIVKNNVK